MHRIAGSIAGAGWKVTLVGRKKKKSGTVLLSNIKVIRVNTWFERGVGFYFVLNVRFFFRALLARTACLMSVDLDTLPAIRLASFLRNKTMIWDCHEIFSQMPELYKNPLKQKTWKLIERLTVPWLGKVIAVNEGVARYLEENYSIHAAVVHNYPVSYPEAIPPEVKLASGLVLFQGAINEGRCLDVLIRAVHRLDPALKLVIIGDGPLKSTMQSLSRSLGLEHRIEFSGELPPEELRKRTPNAFLGISLLEANHGNSLISLANKNLDYIMAGLPALTMSFPEYLKINAQWPVASLLQSVTEETVSKTINRLYHDFAVYKNMHTACLEARQVLCWERESGKLISFLNGMEVNQD